MANLSNRAPVVNFLNKHKWRIVLPLLFALLYWSLPRYLISTVAVQQDLFITSPSSTKDELRAEVASLQEKVLNDAFLADLVAKYDLYPTDGSNKTKIEKLRKSIEIRIEGEDFVQGFAVLIWTHFRMENSEHISQISNDIAAQFEGIQNVRIEKFETKPYDAGPYKVTLLLGGIYRGLLLLVFPLILLWEIPNIFFSVKTHETVLEPLKADWRQELTEARLNGGAREELVVHVRYSIAFVSALLQESPFGSLVEYARDS